MCPRWAPQMLLLSPRQEFEGSASAGMDWRAFAAARHAAHAPAPAQGPASRLARKSCASASPRQPRRARAWPEIRRARRGAQAQGRAAAMDPTLDATPAPASAAAGAAARAAAREAQDPDPGRGRAPQAAKPGPPERRRASDRACEGAGAAAASDPADSHRRRRTWEEAGGARAAQAAPEARPAASPGAPGAPQGGPCDSEAGSQPSGSCGSGEDASSSDARRRDRGGRTGGRAGSRQESRDGSASASGAGDYDPHAGGGSLGGPVALEARGGRGGAAPEQGGGGAWPGAGGCEGECAGVAARVEGVAREVAALSAAYVAQPPPAAAAEVDELRAEARPLRRAWRPPLRRPQLQHTSVGSWRAQGVRPTRGFTLRIQLCAKATLQVCGGARAACSATTPANHHDAHCFPGAPLCLAPARARWPAAEVAAAVQVARQRAELARLGELPTQVARCEAELRRQAAAQAAQGAQVPPGRSRAPRAAPGELCVRARAGAASGNAQTASRSCAQSDLPGRPRLPDMVPAKQRTPWSDIASCAPARISSACQRGLLWCMQGKAPGSQGSCRPPGSARRCGSLNPARNRAPAQVARLCELVEATHARLRAGFDRLEARVGSLAPRDTKGAPALQVEPSLSPPDSSALAAEPDTVADGTAGQRPSGAAGEAPALESSARAPAHTPFPGFSVPAGAPEDDPAVIGSAARAPGSPGGTHVGPGSSPPAAGYPPRRAPPLATLPAGGPPPARSQASPADDGGYTSGSGEFGQAVGAAAEADAMFAEALLSARGAPAQTPSPRAIAADVPLHVQHWCPCMRHEHPHHTSLTRARRRPAAAAADGAAGARLAGARARHRGRAAARAGQAGGGAHRAAARAALALAARVGRGRGRRRGRRRGGRRRRRRRGRARAAR